MCSDPIILVETLLSLKESIPISGKWKSQQVCGGECDLWNLTGRSFENWQSQLFDIYIKVILSKGGPCKSFLLLPQHIKVKVPAAKVRVASRWGWLSSTPCLLYIFQRRWDGTFLGYWYKAVVKLLKEMIEVQRTCHGIQHFSIPSCLTQSFL